VDCENVRPDVSRKFDGVSNVFDDFAVIVLSNGVVKGRVNFTHKKLRKALLQLTSFFLAGGGRVDALPVTWSTCVGVKRNSFKAGILHPGHLFIYIENISDCPYHIAERPHPVIPYRGKNFHRRKNALYA